MVIRNSVTPGLLMCGLFVAGLLTVPVAAQVDAIVTEAFFNSLKKDAGGSVGERFYQRQNFLAAARNFPKFGNSGNPKHEIAAFFANVMHETGSLRFIEQNDKSDRYCDNRYPCPLGKSYYGRGPLQLSWNYNYQAAGKALGFDGIHSPELVATDPNLSFKASLWFWVSNSNCHNAMVSGQGFGATIQAINGDLECNGKDPGAVQSRVNHYRDICHLLGINPLTGGGKLHC